MSNDCMHWVLHSRLTYFWRNLNISSIFYFSKSTSIYTIYSSLWDALKMMLFTKYLIKEKSWKTHRQNQLKISVLVWFKILYRIRYKKIDVILVQCLFKPWFPPYRYLLDLVTLIWLSIPIPFSIANTRHQPKDFNIYFPPYRLYRYMYIPNHRF